MNVVTPSQNSILVNKTYRLKNKIGEGSFGKIFLAHHKDTGEPVIIKLLAAKHEALWQNEILIYERLQGVKYIPSLYAAGSEGPYKYIVMDVLEQNLEQLRAGYGSNMSLKVILHLAVQMVALLEAIHAKGVLHRDIKPANFLLKTHPHSGISEVYMIDFGLARVYCDVPMKTNEGLIGTTRYMSVNVQQGFTASRRDDLESLGYILFFLQKGELPWQNAGEMAAPIKQTFGWAYANAGIAGEFILFILYCRNLSFTANPDYNYLRNLLTNLSSTL
jgi:serine/threonine protein kinase